MTFSFPTFIYESAAALLALGIIAILFVAIIAATKEKWPKKVDDYTKNLTVCFLYAVVGLGVVVLWKTIGFGA